MRKNIVKGDNCLNCNQELTGENYCPNCGQLNNTAKPTFSQLILDALANLFAFDSKFYLSIWPLLTKPGKLSLEVVDGKRSSYLPPIRLFLLITIIMLGLNSLTNRMTRSWDDVDHLRNEKNKLATLDTDSDTTKNNNDIRISFDDNKTGLKLEKMFKFVQKNTEVSADEGLAQMSLKNTFWNRFVYTSLLKLVVMDGEEFQQYIASNLMIILLLFVPILALILKVLYFYKGDYFYVDHFIFSLHSLTAFFTFVIFQIILSWFFSNWTFALVILGFAIYLFVALKNFYKQRLLLTSLNYFVVNISFVIVSFIFILLVGLVSFILF